MTATAAWGLEIEVLLPRGQGRRQLADALARRLGGDTRCRFKHHSWAINDGQPIPCSIVSQAYEVVGNNGETLLSLVDDLSIDHELDAERPAEDGAFRLVLEDADLAEVMQRPLAQSHESLLNDLVQSLGTTLAVEGAPGHRLLRRNGQPVAVVVPDMGERRRVCEIVSPPLPAGAREAFLTTTLACARELDAVVPKQGGMHLHVDAEPWRRTAALRQLIVDYSALRPEVLALMQPNPESHMWRGPFSAGVQDAANKTQNSMPFRLFANWLLALDVNKRLDINILGVLLEKPTLPTLELRILPVDFDVARTLERLDALDAFLAEVLARAAVSTG